MADNDRDEVERTTVVETGGGGGGGVLAVVLLIIVVLVLRSVCRRLSLEELRAVWPGTDDGFAALYQLVRPSGGCRAGSPAT